MGVTVQCKSKQSRRSADLSQSGFMRFRLKVAELCNPIWYEHYKTIQHAMSLTGDARKKFFEEFDRKTEALIRSQKVSVKLVDFCLQSDCAGAIRYGACKMLIRGIGSYSDDRTCYGYSGKHDCAKFDDIKAIMEDCVEYQSDFVWW